MCLWLFWFFGIFNFISTTILSSRKCRRSGDSVTFCIFSLFFKTQFRGGFISLKYLNLCVQIIVKHSRKIEHLVLKSLLRGIDIKATAIKIRLFCSDTLIL